MKDMERKYDPTISIDDYWDIVWKELKCFGDEKYMRDNRNQKNYIDLMRACAHVMELSLIHI